MQDVAAGVDHGGAEHGDWVRDRQAALCAEDGWLNLTDRVEIGAGPQSLGSGPENDVILSVGPTHLGTLTATATEASLSFDGVTHPFVAQGGNPMLRLADLLLELHTVAGQPALRVRDLTRARYIFLPAYPYDPAWNILARWETLEVPQDQPVDQKGAAPTQVSLTHRAHFTHAGQEVTLLATHWKAGKPMFVIRDATSGPETYAASRFLIGEPVLAGEDGQLGGSEPGAGADLTEGPQGALIRLDFNRAHNPPCAFTDFAICPLPPRENRMPFPIRAGEMKLG